jgi:GrpE
MKMIAEMIQLFKILQFAIVPVSLILIVVLVVINIVLLRQIRLLRSQARTSPQPSHPRSFPQSSQSPSFPQPRAYSPVMRLASEANYGPRNRKEAFPSPPNQVHSSPPQQNLSNRDRPASDERWLKLVEECVDLFDDLDKHLTNFDPPRQELAEHMLLQLQEILERGGVELIDNDTTFQRDRHQPERPGAEIAPATTIIKTLSPGFAVGRRVLRRARVRLADSPTPPGRY